MSSNLQDLYPGVDMDFVALMRSGKVTPEAFFSFTKRIEKKVPIAVRVEERLLDMRGQMHALLIGPKDRFRTREEWNEIRKLARNGLRLAKLFKVDDVQYFRPLHDTMVCHLRGL